MLLASIVAALGAGFDPFVQFAVATVQTWFPLLSTFSSIASLVTWIPTTLFRQVFLAGALVYAGILLTNLIESGRKKL
ncbi:hypothetical protein VB773_14230 [Haloarculaceae archaeon H-GB2-1]|nr:hypothetical protein [Haloarculaceae archaeon H-GB2-1]